MPLFNSRLNKTENSSTKQSISEAYYYTKKTAKRK